MPCPPICQPENCEPRLHVCLAKLQALLLSNFQKQTYFLIFNILQMTLLLCQMIVQSVPITRSSTFESLGRKANYAWRKFPLSIAFTFVKKQYFLCRIIIKLSLGGRQKNTFCVSKISYFLLRLLLFKK